MKKTPIIKIKPMKNIWIRDKFTDTDRDGVPNYRDCNILNPHKHLFGIGKKKKRETRDLRDAPYPKPFDTSTDTEENYEKYLASQRRSSTSSSSSTRLLHTIDTVEPKKHIEIYNDIQRGLTRQTLMKKYGQKKVMETFKYILVVERRNLEMGKRPTTTDIQKQEQYLMKRDTLALKMYNDHFVSLAPDQKRNVTREFNRMLR